MTISIVLALRFLFAPRALLKLFTNGRLKQKGGGAPKGAG
jgi:hypothetical protein